MSNAVQRSGRKPTAVRLERSDDGDTVPAEQRPGIAVLAETSLPPDDALPATFARPVPRRGPWLKVAIAGLAGLMSLAAGLAVSDLIGRLFAYTPALGVAGLGFLALFTLALVMLAAREVSALARLARVEHLRDRALAIIASDDREQARVLAGELATLYAARPDMARARSELASHVGNIVDGADLVRLSERHLMGALDREAVALITRAARRVSIVTAVAPRAIFDVAMVLAQSALLVRKLAELYGARPGGLASLKLARSVFGHLAVTGGMALGEGLVEQILGHGVAAKLSAKLGEGVVNGMMTARVGLSALDILRPLPFTALERPKLADILAELTRSS